MTSTTPAQTLDGFGMDHHLDELERNGFTIVPNMIDRQQIDELIPAVERALAEEQHEFGGRPGKSEFIALDIISRGPEFRRLMMNEKMQAVFQRILGEMCILYTATTTILRPHAEHYTQRIHNETVRHTPGYVTGLLCTFALVDFTEETGSTFYLPGSHNMKDKPGEEDFYRDAVRVSRKAGDGVIFTNRVWHAGGVNNSDDTRYGCSFYACRSFMRQRLDYPRMVPADVAEQLTEDQRRFLGFNVRVPTNLGEFYVPPQDRLYKSGQE